MSEKLRCRFVLLVSLLVLCAVQDGLMAEDNARWLVSPELLEHAGLKIAWENELPIKKTESLGQLLMLGDYLYAVSSHNYAILLNKENGKVISGDSIAPAGVPITGLRLYRDKLMYVGGSKLVEVDADLGADSKTIDVGFAIVCPAARNDSYYYLGGIDNRLHVLRAKDRVRVFEVAARNNPTITSIVADEDFVVFATNAGNVISVAADKPARLWQFDAADAIAGPIVRDWMSLFFASKDTNVYRIDMVGSPVTQQLIWKYQTDGMLDKAPRVTQGIVYQHVGGKGITAIDKNSGSFLWSVPGGTDLLAEANSRAYVITKNRTLVVMDNVEAKRLYSVNLAGVSKHVANVENSRIYIADERGRIACLQPAE